MNYLVHMDQSSDYLCHKKGHKYIKRYGSPGHYRYVYATKDTHKEIKRLDKEVTKYSVASSTDTIIGTGASMLTKDTTPLYNITSYGAKNADKAKAAEQKRDQLISQHEIDPNKATRGQKFIMALLR